MTLMRYRNFPEFDDLPNTLRDFQNTVARLVNEPNGARPWSPAVDIFETENEVVLKADLPGANAKDVEVKIENGTLTLRGERKFENEAKDKGYHRLERSYGSFARSFTLPETVDAEKVKAEFKAGVLNVIIPKKEIAKPRTIQVQVAAE